MTFSQIRIAGVAAMALWLAGCATRGSTPPPNLEEGLTGEIHNRVVVDVSTMTHVVRFSDGAIEPDPIAISDLNDFLAFAGASRGASVLVERSGKAIDDDRAAVLVGALSRKGLRPTVRVAAISPGAMRLTIERYVASAPGCPNWSKTPGNDFANTLPSDFGCATAANLAAMVSDPRDLIAGSDMTAGAGDPSVAPMQRYRTGRVLPLSAEGASTSGPHSGTAGGPSS